MNLCWRNNFILPSIIDKSNLIQHQYLIELLELANLSGIKFLLIDGMENE